MAKNKSKINYSQHLREIRPFVNFNFDLRSPLSSAAKAKITKYHSYLQKLDIRQSQVYRTSDPRRLKAAQALAQHDPRYKGIKVAFIPNPGTEHLKIEFDKAGRAYAVGRHATQHHIPLDAIKMATEGAAYIERQLSTNPLAKAYVPQAGEFEVPGAYGRKFITDALLKLTNKYGAENFNADDKNSHYYGNWLFGLTAYNFTNQSALEKYRADKKNSNRIRSSKVKAKRAKMARVADIIVYWANDDIRSLKRSTPPQPEGWRVIPEREYYEKLFKSAYKEIKDRTRR